MHLWLLYDPWLSGICLAILFFGAYHYGFLKP
jgi:hypothetical protein